MANGNVKKLSLDQIMSDRFARYSKYIIQDRALPDARDGLKPVQRRILYSMSELGLFHSKAFKKSARVVGEVIGKYHPHGDSSIYEAMVRMSQDWKMNVPLIQMHGNNGSIDDDPAAAMRYTEARLSKISSVILKSIKKNTVPFAPNFDDSESEPTVLPALIPNLLVNGAKGIAAGYATEMPPHNLGEVIDAIIAKIKTPAVRLSTLIEIMKGPDFPTGGTVQGKQGIYEAYERGRGRIIIRSKYEIHDMKTKPSIVVTEIPYGVVKSKLVRSIDEIRINSSVSGIKEVRDETDRKGTRIVIEMTSGTDPKLILNYLLSKTEMQVYYNYNNVAIKDMAPQTMGLAAILEAYINHQKEIQTRALKFDLNKNQIRLEIVEGLIKVSQMVDQVIEVIRKAEGSKLGVVQALISKFNFTKLQADAIAELRLYRLSKTDQSIYSKEKAELEDEVKRIKDILASPESLNNYLIKVLKEIKSEYATPRKTIIEEDIQDVSFDMEDLIKHEDVWIGISRDGYIKRFSNRAYEANENKDYTLKEGDSLVYLDHMNTADRIAIFTSKGHYYYIPVHKLTETKFKEVGKHLNDFGAIPVDEKIVDAVAIIDSDTEAVIAQVTRKGKVKRTLVKSFEVARYNKTYTSMKVDSDDEMVGAKMSNGYKQLLIINSQGKSVSYPETEIPVQSTKGKGVRGISLSGTHFVSTFALLDKRETLGIVSSRGGMKRIAVADVPLMGRTTQGKRIFREIKGNPHIALAARVVDSKVKAFFTNKNGQIIEVPFSTADRSSCDGGFTQAGPTMPLGAKIMAFDKVYKDNPFLAKPSTLNEEEQFSSAEEAINSASQIDIDDILKDIK